VVGGARPFCLVCEGEVDKEAEREEEGSRLERTRLWRLNGS
jgi:hypothetical protein